MNLKTRYDEMRKERGASYRPRTKHIGSDGWAKYTNRLFLESSPYLLQHAHNPVEWYPWGDEAFQTAEALDRPVLLSIGYSTCHWCHVMEEESFEDREIARYINQNYIAVKVDREERPDVDAVYMVASQVLTGSGGWPLTIWLTPDRKPFYAGTYFPARDGDRGANIGFLTLLKRLKKSYDDRKNMINQASNQLSDAVKKMLNPVSGKQLPSEGIFHKTFKLLQARFDPVNGGILGKPKFPSSLPIKFLFRYYYRYGHRKALTMATRTLDKMAAGGMYDHIGGGFHRYAVDDKWQVPHFEKMLYDNALLAMNYLEGYQVVGSSAYRRIVHEIIHYIQRDMTSPEGAFYSATDADSIGPDGHATEGSFFTWTPVELEKVLGPQQFEITRRYFDIGISPNFEGHYIMHAPRSISEVAGDLNMKEDRLISKLAQIKEILRNVRKSRPAPLRDEKIITAWNGLMISAFAKAGLILNELEYVESAVRSASFLLQRLYIDKKLLRIYKDGSAKNNGFLDDYAYLISGLIDLYEATHDIRWLKQAIEIDKSLPVFFEDEFGGGFFMTSADQEKMIAVEKPSHDGAVPSGNAITAMNLLRLGALTLESSYFKRAEKTLTSFSEILDANPLAMTEIQLAIDFYMSAPKEIVIVTPEGKKDESNPFLEKFRKQFLPSRILSVVSEGSDLEAQARILPHIKDRTALKGKTTAYVCVRQTCQIPADTPDEFAKQISSRPFI